MDEKPKVVTHTHTHTSILLGDVLEQIKVIENESIDLVVTDCPYHIVSGGCSNGAYGNHKEPGGIFERKIVGKNKHGHILEGTKHIALFGILNDNDSTTYARQGKLFKHNEIKFNEWLPEIYRVLKQNTHCYIYINPRNLKELQIEAEKVGFKYQQLIVWKKNNATPNKYYLNSYELILMLRKGNAKNINNLGTKNILEVNNILGGKKTHPTEKPVELNKILIENSTNERDIVLDCFMGTGSTGVACKELNRNFIGIEIDEKYYNIAKQRIENTEETEQLNFFEEV